MPNSGERSNADEPSARQVEVLVYRVLAAVIAFLIAAAVAVVLNGDAGQGAGEQQVGVAVSTPAR